MCKSSRSHNMQCCSGCELMSMCVALLSNCILYKCLMVITLFSNSDLKVITLDDLTIAV